MPDRYGEHDEDEPMIQPQDLDAEPVADFDAGRRARESQAAVQRAREQRARLAESQAVHAPLTRMQSEDARAHRISVTEQAERRRNRLRIADCELCDDEGYTPGLVVCDHIDHRPAAAAGMAQIRAVMGWEGDSDPTGEHKVTAGVPSRGAGPSNRPGTPQPPDRAGRDGYGPRSATTREGEA